MSREYTFRADYEMSLLWAGERSYPARLTRESATDYIPAESGFLERFPDYRMETRRATVCFENQWCLSTIWGDATYSSNRMDLGGHHPFIEEPQLVEVGVLIPAPFTRPAVEVQMGDKTVVLPGRETHLWGDPLAYVSVPEYHRVADLVMMLPTDIDVPEGEWDDADGFCDFLITAGLERTL